MRWFGLPLVLAVAGCSMWTTSPQRLVVERKWVRSTLASEHLGARRMHRFTPILHDKVIIVANSIDGIQAMDRENASVRWRIPIKDGVEGGAYLAEDLLFFGAGDGQLYAVQVDSGRVLWTYPLKAEGLAKPTVRGGVVYVLGGNNVVHALNARSGKLIWQYNRREATNISIRGGCQPAVFGDLVLVGFTDGFLVGLNKSSGALMWEANLNRNKRFRDVDASPVLDGDRAYVSSYDGALYALNASDGRVLWTYEDGGEDEVLLAGNSLFYSTSSGKTVALDKNSGKVIWIATNPKGIATAPVLVKNLLAVGEMNGALLLFDARSGELVRQFEPGWGVTSRATLDSKRGDLYFLSAGANLFALRVGWQRFGQGWSQ